MMDSTSVTDELKYFIKLGRQNAIHVTVSSIISTFIFNTFDPSDLDYYAS
jgi:hypothetical protein